MGRASWPSRPRTPAAGRRPSPRRAARTTRSVCSPVPGSNDTGASAVPRCSSVKQSRPAPSPCCGRTPPGRGGWRCRCGRGRCPGTARGTGRRRAGRRAGSRDRSPGRCAIGRTRRGQLPTCRPRSRHRCRDTRRRCGRTSTTVPARTEAERPAGWHRPGDHRRRDRLRRRRHGCRRDGRGRRRGRRVGRGGAAAVGGVEVVTPAATSAPPPAGADVGGVVMVRGDSRRRLRGAQGGRVVGTPGAGD